MESHPGGGETLNAGSFILISIYQEIYFGELEIPRIDLPCSLQFNLSSALVIAKKIK
jgi:hypothetical protein